MDLEELRGFLAVVDTGSMLGAATRLGIPRGTLRRRVDSLEARAGVPLLERSAKGVSPTAAGSLLAERGRRLLLEGAALLSATREAGREPSGSLRVRVGVGFPPSAFVTVVELARLLMPKVQLCLQMRARPFEPPLQDVDAVFGLDDDVATVPGWGTHELMRVPVQLLAAPAYLEDQGHPTSVESLRDHSLAAWGSEAGGARRWLLRSGGHVELTPMVVSNDAHVLRQYALAELGLALVPNAQLDLLGLPTDRLVPVLDDVIGGSVPLVVGMSEAFSNSSRSGALLELLRKLVPGAETP